VTDHHLPGDAVPAAACIVNPNQAGCGFPSKHLAGVGVIFYVMLALRAELRARGAFAGKAEPNLADLLDLVALGTVADVARLDANNRILVTQGLARIRALKACPGTAALLQVADRPARQAGAYDLASSWDRASTPPGGCRTSRSASNACSPTIPGTRSPSRAASMR